MKKESNMNTEQNKECNKEALSIEVAITNHTMQANASRKHNDRRGVFYSAEEHEQIAKWFEELRAYREAEEQELLLKPQLKLGDTVYIISRNEVLPIEINSILYNEYGLRFLGRNEKYFGYGDIALYPDKRIIEWYSEKSEAELISRNSNKDCNLEEKAEDYVKE